MLRLRAEVIVEEEKRHPEWWNNVTHCPGREVWYNKDTQESQYNRPRDLPLEFDEWRGVGDGECAMGHDGMPKQVSGVQQPWLVRREGQCECRYCVFPRYLHFAEPNVTSDGESATYDPMQQPRTL